MPASLATMEKERDFHFTDRDFDRIRSLVRRHAGISLSDAKKDMVYSRLSRRLRKLGLRSFNDYCGIIESGDPDEIVNFTNSITTNLTSFFRENHHFQYLADTLIPELRERKRYNRRLRIWSAGCSTGEEPYSIAMVLREQLPAHEGWDARILATDLDSNVLQTAQEGIYDAERIRTLPASRVRRWFLKGRGRNAGTVRAHPDLRGMITFRQLNLLGPWPIKGPIDFIFCRNVVIYFDKDTQRTLFDRYADILEPEGRLFIGHSESLFKVCNRFELIGKTIYRKLN